VCGRRYQVTILLVRTSAPAIQHQASAKPPALFLCNVKMIAVSVRPFPVIISWLQLLSIHFTNLHHTHQWHMQVGACLVSNMGVGTGPADLAAAGPII